MVLADSINLPLVAGLGLVTLGPLTLLVTVIETFVFRLSLGTGFRDVFKRVLVANILSTLAGGLLMMFQDAAVFASGIHESIPAFVRGYRWVGPLLIGGYFAKSLLVEGLWLTRRRFLERIQRGAGGALRAVLLGNVASYLVVGPLFYFTTRPYFAAFDTTFDAHWTANPDLVVYYIDHDSKFVKRMRLDGRDNRTLVPHPAWSFLVSADESTCAFVGTDGKLFAHRAGDQEPILVWDTDRACFITSVSLSPDNRRLAYREPPPSRDGRSLQLGDQDTITAFDLGLRQAQTIGTVPAKYYGYAIAWSADGRRIYAQVIDFANEWKGDKLESSETRWVYVLNAEPPYGMIDRLTTPPPLEELVENYVRGQGREVYMNGTPLIELPRRSRGGDYQFEAWPYLGSAIRVMRDGTQLFVLRNEYGLLNLSLPPIESAAFLPSNDEVLLEWWDQLYVLSLQTRKLGLAAHGEEFVLRTPEFRVSFQPPG